MKKLLMLFVIAGFVTACNNDSASTDDVQDSVIEAIDSTQDARIDSIETTTDSVKEKVENSFEKTDSANKAIADSAR